MTPKGTFSLNPADLTSAHAQRIRAQVGQLLDDPAMSSAAQQTAMNALCDQVLPPPAAPQPPQLERPEPPIADWALDDHRAPPARLTGDSDTSSSWSAATTTDGGGGKVAHPFDLSTPPNHDEDDEIEDRFELWHPPKREPVVVPDNVADIAPVDAGGPGPDAGSAPDTDPIPAQPSIDPPAPSSKRAARDALLTRWKTLPGWAQIAAPAAAGMVVVLAVAMLFAGHSEPAPIDAPPPSPEPAASAPAGPATAPLMPASVTMNCPAGSSPNPGLVFGTDKSQALICTRIFNVDNAVVTITFNQPMVVCEITVVPGFDYVEKNGEDHWNEHRLVTQILWRFPSQIVQKINPAGKKATLTLKPCIATQVITATIQKTERPPAVPNKGGGLLPGILGGPDNAKVDGSFAIGHLEIRGYPA